MKYVNVAGKRFRYEGRFDVFPYCYFDIDITDEAHVFSIARAVEERCKRRFKSAELSRVEAKTLWNKSQMEVRVIFFISDEDRLRYLNERKGQGS